MNKLALVLLMSLPALVQAQTIWRCGNDGAVVYTDEPCATGRALTATDPRTPEQVQAASRRVIRPETSVAMRFLMRLNAERGSGRRADVEGYYVGDKTGTAFSPGMGNKTNDIAIVWRAGRAPLVVAAYYESPGFFDRIRAEDEAVLAQVGKLFAGWV